MAEGDLGRLDAKPLADLCGCRVSESIRTPSDFRQASVVIVKGDLVGGQEFAVLRTDGSLQPSRPRASSSDSPVVRRATVAFLWLAFRLHLPTIDLARLYSRLTPGPHDCLPSSIALGR